MLTPRTPRPGPLGVAPLRALHTWFAQVSSLVTRQAHTVENSGRTPGLANLYACEVFHQ
jgi:hypothetical protein